MKEIKNNVAVVMVNFGGPQTYEDIKPFLYNLFIDPVILNVSNLLRKPLAWFISNMRDFKSRLMYRCVNGSTPLIPISYIQADKLQEKLNFHNKHADVFVAFRYCEPSIQPVLDRVKASGYEKVVILPMFPQYSFTTTGSVQIVVNEWIHKNNNDSSLEVDFINDWYKDSDYIEAYTRLIEKRLKYFDQNQNIKIVFSAHSIPMFNIENGDPYENHIKETAKLIIDRLSWKKDWQIGYQSKVGPVKWLEPETGELIEKIAKESKDIILIMVPISFVCEHVETIYEIGKLYKDIAKKVGIKNFVRIPALNTNKFLIQALYNQVLNCIEGSVVKTNIPL